MASREEIGKVMNGSDGEIYGYRISAVLTTQGEAKREAEHTQAAPAVSSESKLTKHSTTIARDSHALNYIIFYSTLLLLMSSNHCYLEIPPSKQILDLH